MTKKDDEGFKDFTKCGIFDNVYVDFDVKVRDGKCRGSAHKDCNIKVKLNYKTGIVLYNVNNFESHLVMQDLGKLNFKIRAITNGLEKYMSFRINNKLSFIDSFHMLSSS